MLRNNSQVDPLRVGSVQCWGFTHHRAAQLAVAAVSEKLHKLSEDLTVPNDYQNHTLVRIEAPEPGDNGSYFVSTIHQGEYSSGSYFHRGIGYRYNSNGEQTGPLAVVRRDWLMQIKWGLSPEVTSCQMMVGVVPCE